MTQITAEFLELIPDHNTPDKILMEKEEGENINLYREASKRFITIMSLALSFILEHKNQKLATIAVGYALGLDSITNGKSQREMARDIGVSSGTISWTSQQFKSYANIKL
jgi:hypothetical protein